MSVLVWILLGLAAWLVIGTAVALVVGRMVRQRDRQIPSDLLDAVAENVPDPRDGSDRSSLEGSATRRTEGGAPRP